MAAVKGSNVYRFSMHILHPSFSMNHVFLSSSSDKMFPAFGFGALIPPDFKVGHIRVRVFMCGLVCLRTDLQ